MRKVTSYVAMMGILLSLSVFSIQVYAEEVEEAVGDTVIENDNFQMTFESIEVYDDGTIWLSDTSNISTTLAEGCKRYALKTEFKNFSSTAIDNPEMTFNISLLINGEYSYDSHSTGIIVPSFTLDPLCDDEIYIYADIPENALNILDTAVFTIAFNDDLSSVIPVTNMNSGETTVEADNFYTISCTSSEVQFVQRDRAETETETLESKEAEPGETGSDAAFEENMTEEETKVESGATDTMEAIEIGLNGIIENDNFRMTFESIEVYDDGTIWLSDTSNISTTLAEGCKRYALKTEFENFSSTAIDNPEMTFNISLLINGEYSYDSHSTGIIVPSFTLDPLCDDEIYIYADIPENALNILDTAVFTIAFNDDLSSVIPVTNMNSGETTVEADNFYAINCTSSTEQAAQGEEE